jgi:hypothetical protein
MMPAGLLLLAQDWMKLPIAAWYASNSLSVLGLWESTHRYIWVGEGRLEDAQGKRDVVKERVGGAVKWVGELDSTCVDRCLMGEQQTKTGIRQTNPKSQSLRDQRRWQLATC